jgi:hypothetical protein
MYGQTASCRLSRVSLVDPETTCRHIATVPCQTVSCRFSFQSLISSRYYVSSLVIASKDGQTASSLFYIPESVLSLQKRLVVILLHS